MSSRRVELLIHRIRRETGNTVYGSNSGIRQSQICEYLNQGLAFIEEGIASQFSAAFHAETTIDLVASQESYDLPVDMLLGGGVVSLELLLDNGHYKKLRRRTSTERSSGEWTGEPHSYYTQGRKLYLNSIPDSSKTGGLRLTYVKQLNRLGIRSATVDAVTFSGNSILTLTLNPASIAAVTDEFSENDYFCIVDADGNFKTKNIPYTSVNPTTGAVTVRAGYTKLSSETIAPSHYVVLGRYTSTHQLDLDANVERFLMAYASWKILREDSNEDSQQQLGELTSMRDSILDSYASMNNDILFVPEILEE